MYDVPLQKLMFKQWLTNSLPHMKIFHTCCMLIIIVSEEHATSIFS